MGSRACASAGSPAATPTLLRRMERVKHYLSICNAAPCEVLARIALKAGDRILARNRLIATRNLAMLDPFLTENGDLFDWHVPDGGVVGYPRYLGAEGAEAFCARLIEEHGVMLLPASIYRSEILDTPADRFRIGFGRRDFPAGLEAMQTALRRRPATARRARQSTASLDEGSPTAMGDGS